MAHAYVGSVQHAAVTQWAASQAVSVGAFRRQLASPSVGNERVWRCTTAGTTGGSEPAWSLTKGATTNDNGVVWTEVTGSETYNWSAPHARIAQAINATTSTISTDGSGKVFVASDHAETQAAAITLTPSFNSNSIPLEIICVDPAGSVPPLAADLRTGASVTTTGANNIAINGGNSRGICIYRGIAFSSGTGAGSQTITLNGGNAGCVTRFVDCALKVGSTGSSGSITFSSQSGRVEFINTTVEFGALAQSINKGGACDFIWKNTPNAIQGATLPDRLFGTAQNGGRAYLEGVDLSALGTGKFIVEGASISAVLANCKLNANVTVSRAVNGFSDKNPHVRVDVVGCDSGNTNYRNESYQAAGTLTTETTLVRTGGASDGTTPYSWKVVTTGVAGFLSPFEIPTIVVWNETVGSPVTATIEIMNDGTTLKDDEMWLDAEYMGDASYPLAAGATGTKTYSLDTGANLPTSSEAWTTTGLSSPIKQMISVSFTPQQKGWVRLSPKVARASKTLYIDPKAALV